MAMAFYIALLFLPLLFLIGKRKKEAAGAVFLIAVFLLIHGGFVSGQQTVAWDTISWSLGLQYIKNIVQSGHMPGWNPYFNSGEPLYIYHYAFAQWQWFFFVIVDYLLPLKPVVLFNLFFVFLYIFYNIGCYLVFLKIFKDMRVAFFCLAVSIFALTFVVYNSEHSSFYISIYFPYIIYFFLEFIERRSKIGLALIPVLLGVAANTYIPHFVFLAFAVFVVSYIVFMDREHYTLKFDRRTIFYGIGGLALTIVLVLPVIYVFFKLGDYISPIRMENIMYAQMEYRSLIQFFTVSHTNRCIMHIGLIPLTLVGIGVFKSSNRFRWTVLCTAVAIFLISLGRNSFPYQLLHYLPTFGYIRHYIIFEIFVQFFAIILAGMGLEYILSITDREKKEAYILTGITFSAVFAVYGVIRALDHKEHLLPIIPDVMYIVFFIMALAVVLLLIQSRSARNYVFLMSVVILAAGTMQWYSSYLTEEAKDSGELVKLNELLNRDHGLHWVPSRQSDYEQRIRVANTYNTFESALGGVETSFLGAVERILLVNKRYYELAVLRKDAPEYLGVNHPKVFLTDNFKVVPSNKVIPAMQDGYYDYLSKKTIYFSEEDFKGAAVEGGSHLCQQYSCVQGQRRAHEFDESGELKKSSVTTAFPTDNYLRVKVDRYTPDRLTLDVDSPGGVFLVYLQNYDKDWRAYVNGAQTPILRVNYEFQAVYICPKGKATVEFRYASLYKYLISLHLIGAAFSICLVFYAFHKERKKSDIKLLFFISVLIIVGIFAYMYVNFVTKSLSSKRLVEEKKRQRIVEMAASTTPEKPAQQNLFPLINSSLESWHEVNNIPDRWSYAQSGSGGSVYKEVGAKNVKFGLFSARVVKSNTGASQLYYTLSDEDAKRLRGKTILFGGWIKSQNTVSDKISLSITSLYIGQYAPSSYYQNTGEWEFVYFWYPIPNDAKAFNLYINIDSNANADAYFDGAVLAIR